MANLEARQGSSVGTVQRERTANAMERSCRSFTSFEYPSIGQKSAFFPTKSAAACEDVTSCGGDCKNTKTSIAAKSACKGKSSAIPRSLYSSNSGYKRNNTQMFPGIGQALRISCLRKPYYRLGRTIWKLYLHTSRRGARIRCGHRSRNISLE